MVVDITDFASGQEEPDQTDDNPNLQQHRRKVTRSFKRMKSQLDKYVEIPNGHHFEFEGESSQFDPVGTNKRPVIPMMISIDPPIDFPSGNFAGSRYQPAPEQVDMKLTRVADPAELQGEFTVEPDTESGRPGIQTQFSRSVGDSGEKSVSDFRSYISNLAEQYRSFQKNKRKAEDIEDLSTTEVEGREEKKDQTLRGNLKVQKDRSPEENEEFIRQQAEFLKDLDPMFMYINPNSFNRSYSQITANHKTRSQHVVHHFQQEMPTIKASGKVGGFFVHQEDENGNVRGGITRRFREHSLAYKKFMTLYTIYRNNGYLYNTDNRISMVGGVKLFYDGKAYIGSFDDFSFSESDEEPFTMEYNFTFTVRNEVDFQQIPDGSAAGEPTTSQDIDQETEVTDTTPSADITRPVPTTAPRPDIQTETEQESSEQEDSEQESSEQDSTVSGSTTGPTAIN